VLYYLDEGRDCRYSGRIIREAAARAKKVLVLRPGNPGDRAITRRRGQRKYRFLAEGPMRRLGWTGKGEVFRSASGVLEKFAAISSRKDRVAVSVLGIKTENFPLHLPHRIQADVLLTYPDEAEPRSLKGYARQTVIREVSPTDYVTPQAGCAFQCLPMRGWILSV